MPAPVSRRPPVPPAAPRRVAPRTTVAPFPVAAPEAQPDKYSPERLAETPLPGSPPSGLPLADQARPAPSSARTPAPSLPEGHPSAPVPERPVSRRVQPQADPYSGPPTQAEPAPVRARDEERSAPWSTGPAGVRAQPRPASAALAAGLPAGVRPGQGSAHPSGPAYGDWTRPSRSTPERAEERIAPPPATTAIPEREISRGRQGAQVDEDDYDYAYDGYDDAADGDYAGEAYTGEDYYDEPVRGRSSGAITDAGPLTDPGTGPSTQVRGGRAADRAARQAVDVERRKELKRQGETLTARDYLDGKDDAGGRGAPKRLVMALVAVAVVALGVLGVYSFTSPKTQEAASGGAAGTSAAAPPSGVADATLPPLDVEPAPVEQAPATPVRVPVTVLNATDVTGLAGRIAEQFQGGGWETPATGGYTGGDVPVTTVFFTEGDETQRQAAEQLVEQFPQITGGPTPRFFEVPDQPTPGLVVVVAGDWQP